VIFFTVVIFLMARDSYWWSSLQQTCELSYCGRLLEIPGLENRNREEIDDDGVLL
jgi:hypothetical protein